MDYEKKLALAKEALDSGSYDKETIEYIFPELKESDDERIRKEIIAVLKEIEYDEEWCGTQNIKRYIAWLEKQNEQKPADKIELKFKVGDWVVNKDHSYLIADIDFLDNRYLFEIGGYTHEQLNWEYIEDVDNKYHLWAIQDDAKDGDILMSRAPFIYGRLIPYGGLDWYNGKFIKASNYVFKDSPVHPATKEQRDTLMKAMADAGYTFDFEKKELKKIEQKPAFEMKTPEESLGIDSDTYNKIVDECVYELEEQKPAWSKEDEEQFSFCCAAIELSNYSSDEHRNYAISFLESLKERVQPQQKQEWSEEDEKKLLCICAWIKDYPRIADFTDEMYTVANNYIDWLKSLRPQNKGKLSDEQMEYLSKAILTLGNEGDCKTASILNELRTNLKKL